MSFDLEVLQACFYEAVREALDRFALTAENAAVYALVFDCDSDVGQICLRYANAAHFAAMLQSYERYKYMYEPEGYGKYGLRGYKYSVGDFPFIEFDYPAGVTEFLDTYYYYETGDYCGAGEPIAGLESSYKEIWRAMILSCIRRLQAEYTGLRTTEDFIVYMCDHDQSDEDTEALIQLTVDADLFKRLLQDSYL